MNITDELRKRTRQFRRVWVDPHSGDLTYITNEHACPPSLDAMRLEDYITAIADRIDAEHQKAIRELNDLADASVLLPVDPDDEVIHVCDTMERGKARGRVIALMLSEYPKDCGGGLHWEVQLEGEQSPTAFDFTLRHYHEPTVEDVLTEFGIDWEHESDCEDRAALLKEYAAKLREMLAGDAE